MPPERQRIARPHCHALLASIDWVVIGTISVPSEPAAETMPSVSNLDRNARGEKLENIVLQT